MNEPNLYADFGVSKSGRGLAARAGGSDAGRRRLVLDLDVTTC
jgi:hypothetical protein